MKKPINITIPITKIDEDQRMVYGYATVEEIDAHGEIISYDASKKAFPAWIGNIREMHTDVAVGKNVETTFDDDAKAVWIGARISESDDGEQAWIKVKEGVYSGFSIGGKINDAEVQVMTVDGKKKAVTVITDYDLGEVSLVDNPACPSAIFQMVKSVGGNLDQVEEIQKGIGRPVHWWEHAYKFADNQKIIKSSILVYNEDSMAKKKGEIKKSLWEAAELLDLAMCLSSYIWWTTWENEDEDLSSLKSALEAIKQAASKEILEPDPSLDDAIENAFGALNITKKEEISTMAKNLKPVKKSVVGSEDRDADANVVVSAEENGRPVNDTEDRAAEAGVPVAGSVVEQDVLDADGKPTGEKETVKQPLLNGQGQELVEVDNDGEAVVDEDEEEKEEVVVPAPVVDDKDKDDGKKYAPVADLKKSNDDANLAKMVAAAVAEGIAKAVAPLKEQIAELENNKPAPSKVKKTYIVKKEDATVTESAPDNSEFAKLKNDFDELNKRADELAADPRAGTMVERNQVALKLRKLSRQMDPASVAQHAAIRANFQP